MSLLASLEIFSAIQHFDLLTVRAGDQGCCNRMSLLPHLLTLPIVTFVINLVINPVLADKNIHTFHPQVIFIVLITAMGNMVNMGNIGNMGHIGFT